jgi:hypothetical protein
MTQFTPTNPSHDHDQSNAEYIIISHQIMPQFYLDVSVTRPEPKMSNHKYEFDVSPLKHAWLWDITKNPPPFGYMASHAAYPVTSLPFAMFLIPMHTNSFLLNSILSHHPTYTQLFLHLLTFVHSTFQSAPAPFQTSLPLNPRQKPERLVLLGLY